MKYDHIQKDSRKKIFLLSDDMRTHSGIATISKELVLRTAHRYNWVQLGGLINHQEKGKIFDLSQATNEETKLTDSSVKIYPCDGYGNPDLVRQIIGMEKPDAILHFTDPRFWIWLYEMEGELRNNIPLTYLNIWDDIPYPMWNKPYYQSCDALFAISKQTYNINRYVLGEENVTNVKDLEAGKPMNHLVHYVPHGVNPISFHPIDKENEEEYAELVLFKKELFGDKKYDYVVFYNSRNIHRKHPSDIMLAFKHFCDSIGKEKSDKCVLLLHTQPMDDAGTDLISVKNSLCLDYNVVFSHQRLETKRMNFLYNIASVVLNISSNEGFGISASEGMMSGTPLVLNVTGGLQDQMGFVDDEGKPIEFTFDWGSNHDGRYKTCGKHVYPIFPSNRSIQGSVATPYIFDDRASIDDIAAGIYYWYAAGSETRTVAGLLGRNFATNGEFNSDHMADTFIEGMDATIKYWKPKNKFKLYKTDKLAVKSGGYKLKEIDKSLIESKLKEDWE